MKTAPLLASIAIVIVAATLWGIAPSRAGEPPTGKVEYVTLRWDGRDNTHVIRPGGMIECLGPKFRAIKKPEHTDDRAFFMNLALNALAQQGYELVAMTPDDYVLRRTVPAAGVRPTE
jgi:hypothetical protein